jgi:hypothetical protein
MNTAAALRLAFDQSFARAPAAAREPMADYVAIRFAEASYALPMRQLGGLHTGVDIVPCPSPLPEFLGLLGLPRTLVPVYDLTVLLGHASGGSRWVVLSADRLVGFAFDQFDGHFRAAPSHATARDQGREVVLHDGRAWPVVDLASLEAGLRQRAESPLPTTEYP